MKKLIKTLKSMYNEGGDDNFLTIAQEPYYIQVNAQKKGQQLYVDAVSNAHLQEDEFLSEEQVEKIKGLGLEEDPQSNNFSIEVPFGEAKVPEIDGLIVKLLEIYGIDPHKSEFDLELG